MLIIIIPDKVRQIIQEINKVIVVIITISNSIKKSDIVNNYIYKFYIKKWEILKIKLKW